MATTDTHSLPGQAQAAVAALKQIIHTYIERNPGATSTDVVNALGIYSDYEGNQKNYLSWSIIGLLVNEKKIRYEQAAKGKSKHYFSNN